MRFYLRLSQFRLFWTYLNTFRLYQLTIFSIDYGNAHFNKTGIKPYYYVSFHHFLDFFFCFLLLYWFHLFFYFFFYFLCFSLYGCFSYCFLLNLRFRNTLDFLFLTFHLNAKNKNHTYKYNVWIDSLDFNITANWLHWTTKTKKK